MGPPQWCGGFSFDVQLLAVTAGLDASNMIQSGLHHASAPPRLKGSEMTTKFKARTGRAGLDKKPETDNVFYEMQVRFGWSWLDRADEYRRAALVLWELELRELDTIAKSIRARQPVSPPVRYSNPSITCMAVALENLFKGIIAGDKSVKPVKPNGKLSSHIAGHNLTALYENTGMPKLTAPDEVGMLKLLGVYADGHGRYPVGKSSSRTLQEAGFAYSAATVFDRLYFRAAEELLRRHNPQGATVELPAHGKVQLDRDEWVNWKLYRQIPTRLP